MRSELKNTAFREKLDTLVRTVEAEEKEVAKSRGLTLNVFSVRTSGMTTEGSKIVSVILVADHQVVKNLSEQSEITELLEP